MLEKNLVFDLDSNNYDKMRPTYCRELFDDIKKYCHGKTALEVGLGTGQATLPFLRAGYDVTGLEPGSNMHSLATMKFLEYKTFHCLNTSFENFTSEHDVFDLVYSATAFHFIPAEIAFPKAYYLLKKGGTIALFWNTPDVSHYDDSVHYAIGEVYKKYTGKSRDEVDMSMVYEMRLENLKKYGFEETKFKLYNGVRRMNSIEYARLIETYSDVIMMENKNMFLSEIVNAIERNGGIVTIYDTMDLYLGRK